MARPKKDDPSSLSFSFQTLLHISESYLQTRNFACAHQYALLAQQSDPAHPDPHLLIAISSVLKAPSSDLYSILSLPPFTQNHSLIQTHFQNLTSFLNPTQNPRFPFAAEAYALVVKAWGVLSHVEKKMKYDQGFRTFWTICPYCYHLFEYLKVYEGCCLRCQNGSCGRVFDGVALGEAPPEAVLEKGVYTCHGFVALGGGKAWSPFGLVGSFPCGTKEEEKVGGEYVSIQISDSDDEREGDGNVGKGKGLVEDNVGGVGVDCRVKVEEETGVGKRGVLGEMSVGEVGKQKGCGGVVVCGKRIKKSVPVTAKKIMGKGVRVKRGEVLKMQSVENLGCGGGGYMSNSLSHGAETCCLEDEDDDILVMLQDVVVPTV